ncbi:YjaA family stress response protein [Pectobacterium polonicum]|uniref:YjaA family stress response protein n=1 Tax=Pectobacterium polonicum TaxID=2485124 RepID=UPI00235E925B|nr:YjaA family stress response protein [Pectobacterium polonicum]MDC9819056.1 YjaA family stress response protein [Pectobacterium polonicum]
MASLYIRIYRDTLMVRNVDTQKEVTEQSEIPFTTTRLLLGQMIPAMKLLDRLTRKVAPKRLIDLFSSHKVIIHATEMNEGGHSQVEFASYIELAKSISPQGKHIYVCSKNVPLTDQEVIQIFSGDMLSIVSR